MTANAFAYAVSRQDREQEISRESALIAQYDARMALPELPARWGEQAGPWDLVAWEPGWAAAMGCDGNTLRALIEYIEAYESPLLSGDRPSGWHRIGEAEARRLEAVYGTVYRIGKTKALRAFSLRRCATARRALRAS